MRREEGGGGLEWGGGGRRVSSGRREGGHSRQLRSIVMTLPCGARAVCPNSFDSPHRSARITVFPAFGRYHSPTRAVRNVYSCLLLRLGSLPAEGTIPSRSQALLVIQTCNVRRTHALFVGYAPAFPGKA